MSDAMNRSHKFGCPCLLADEDTFPKGSRLVPAPAPGDGGATGARRGHSGGETREGLGVPGGRPCPVPALALFSLPAGVAG